jgi:hypothetical protein
VSAVASVTAGHAFAVHAAVIAGVGRKVTFQHRLVGGKWHSDGTFLTGSSAHVGRAYKTLPAGKYQFRAVLRAKGSHKAVASHLVTVTVTAAPPPAATFALPGAGNENVAIPFTYSVTNAPSGATVVLQRQQGTAEAWGTVLTLPVSGAGSASAPGVAMGQYWYRIELLATGGAVLALDQSIITVFGNVPLAALIGGDTSRTVISGGHTLPYVFSDNYDSKVISTTLSVCQSFTLTWLALTPLRVQSSKSLWCSRQLTQCQ